jgi:pimeloyl-ACP methyl ester carboxylesterase
MPDLPGHGLSGRPDAPYTLEWYARTMRSFFDALSLPRAHVIGHSFGGGVAQWMVLEARERIDRMMLVAPGGLGSEVSLGLRMASFPVLAPLLAPRLMGVGTQVMMRTGLGELVKPEEDVIARIAWRNSAPGTARAVCRTVSGCIDMFGQTVQSWDRIHEVAELPPMALVWGDRDRILPVHHGIAAAERFEGATFARYLHSGHFPHLEESGRFVDDAWRFLGGEPSRTRLRPATVRARPMGRVRRIFLRLGGN